MILSFHSKKEGDAYVASDNRYHVKKSPAGWRLHNVETGAWWHLCRSEVEALDIATERIRRIHDDTRQVATRDRRINRYRSARAAYIATPYGSYGSRKRMAFDIVLQELAGSIRVLRNLEQIDHVTIDAQDGVEFHAPTVPA